MRRVFFRLFLDVAFLAASFSCWGQDLTGREAAVDSVHLCRTVVRVVTENECPVPDLEVEYLIFGEGGLRTVAQVRTDSLGRAFLDAVPGQMLVWASDGAKFDLASLDREDLTLILAHFEGELFSMDLDLKGRGLNPLGVGINRIEAGRPLRVTILADPAGTAQLPEGYYLVTTCLRQPGGILALHLQSVTVAADRVNEIPVLFRGEQEFRMEVTGLAAGD